MSKHSPENQPPDDPILEAGLEALRYASIPGLMDLRADIYWVRTNERLGSETPALDREFSEQQPLRPEDVARVNPEVIAAANKARRALSEVVYALGELMMAKDEFYKVFEDVRYGESKNGGLDMSGINSPGDM